MVKKGFTLSEILIALGILGVLASILLPTLQSTMPNKNNVMFKKAYNTLLQEVSNLINDDVNYPGTKPIILSDGNTYQQGFNYTTATTNTTNAKFPYFLADALNTLGTPTIIARTATGQSRFITSDGIVWTIYLPYADNANDAEGAAAASSTTYQFPIISTEYTTKVIVDVDGPLKGSNCSADSGFVTALRPTAVTPTPAYSTCVSTDTTNAPCQKKPDTFIMGIRYDGKVQVGCTSAAGTVCTAPTDACATFILSNPTNNN